MLLVLVYRMGLVKVQVCMKMMGKMLVLVEDMHLIVQIYNLYCSVLCIHMVVVTYHSGVHISEVNHDKDLPWVI